MTGDRLRFADDCTHVRDMSCGRRLKTAMNYRRVTIAELSRQTNLSEDTIKSLRSGRREGSLSTWRILSRRLGCSMDYLAGTDSDPGWREVEADA